ncbi:MAG: SDR family oxidoreductase [Treponema sp.]|nr:SDR family oxidoreductase [Treponema sp.]
MESNNGRETVVVLTGGARGIGYGLAEAFLARGCSVVISGRNGTTVAEAVRKLDAEAPGRAAGTVCDVRNYRDVRGLWDFAAARFGRVDIWINNAGIGQPQSEVDFLDPDLVGTIFATNCAGALYGCKVALAGMKAAGRGAVYNMEGLGSGGEIVRGMAAYGASKRALAYITDAAAREARGTGVIVGAIRPGMTATDLITAEYRGKPEEWARVRRIFNILSDTVQTISPWIADRVLRNRRNGARIVWLTGAKAAGRFLAAPFVRRSIYPDQLP